MKVLYAIQGTGNGHISRAREIVPILNKLCDLEVMISGIQADIEVNFDIKIQLKGLSFIFGKKGGIDLWKTIKDTEFLLFREEIKKIDIEQYDLIINDFEPISAWAAKLHNIPCISLSHQSAVIAPESPKPTNNDFLGQRILKHYAPTTDYIGFHFYRYNQKTFTPVIRKEIRNLHPTNKGHYTVYLPAYGDEQLIAFFNEFPNIKWQVFSKHSKKEYQINQILIKPVNNNDFIKSFESCEGIICGAGFEAPAEALFLKKKLLVIPMKNQYEQQCNAEALRQLGIPVIKTLKNKYISYVSHWLNHSKPIQVDYKDETELILKKILNKYAK